MFHINTDALGGQRHHRQLWATWMWVLRTKCGSSAKAILVLNRWAISSVPKILVFVDLKMKLLIIQNYGPGYMAQRLRACTALVSQKTQVQVPEPTWWLTATYKSHFMWIWCTFQDSTGICTHTHSSHMQAHTHTYTHSFTITIF